ncbi:MAG: protein kinase [Polyangiales bacterium]
MGHDRDATQSTPALHPGDRVDDRYEVVRLLGEGGFGAVYEAHHLGLDRRVALKVMRPELSRDGLAVARFQLEARTVSRLRHPHIVEVSDFGDDQGRFYLAMEFLEGESLQSLFTREAAVPFGELVALALPSPRPCTTRTPTTWCTAT